ncbi:MAG: SRPBCC family protein [Actinomycetota bacterium]|nr:SRPBCC family protein [Actinomycetota bacterium]
MKVEREIDLPASPDQVYEILMDPVRLGDWVTIHERFEDAPDRLAQGSNMTQKLKVAGQRFTVRWTVTQAERPSKVTWEGRGPAGTSARVVYDLDERDGGTRFTYLNEYELPGGAAGRIAGRAISAAAGREVERSLERLRKLLEG